MSLTCEDVRNLFDYRDGDLWWRVRLSNCVDMSKPAGGFDAYGYRVIGINGRRHKAHRLIWLYVNGEWPSKHIDHIDSNVCNNLIGNLREATMSENGRNTGVQSNNQSGFKGVYQNKGKWCAQITINGNQRYLGRFDSPDEAHEAYCKASVEFHGEFARVA